MSRRVAQVQVQLVFVDEFDALAQEGPYPFSGDQDGTAVAKAVEFLDTLAKAGSDDAAVASG